MLFANIDILDENLDHKRGMFAVSYTHLDVYKRQVEAVCIQDLAYDGGRHLVEGTQREIPAQLVLIAKGFLGADDALFEAFGVTGASDADELHGLLSLIHI